MRVAPRSLFRSLSWWVPIALTFAWGVPDVRADDPPGIALVLEAGGTRIDPERVRAGLSHELGLPVISILESPRRPTIGVLAVAITERGRRAAIRFLPNDGVRYAVMLDVRGSGRIDPLGTWLVTPCASTVRTSRERRAAQEPTQETLDPWIAAHAVPDAGDGHVTLNPWEGTPRAAPRLWVTDVRVAEEVENPWADALTRYREEQAQRVAPSAGRRR